MVLPDIKKLKELLKLLRSQGVLQYNSTDLQLVLTELPITPAKSALTEDIIDTEEDPQAEIERLIDYSSRSPSEDI